MINNCLKTAYGFTRDSVKVTLADLREIKQRTKGRLVVKGVMCLEDALLALENGADDIWVSNGGRTLPTAIEVFPAIVQGVKQKFQSAQIFIDSGVVRGTDVMKCLAFGASGVFISRPIAWSLYYNGEQGCFDLASMLNEELRLAMALTHCFKVSEITEK